MISNERQSPYGSRSNPPSRSDITEETLKTEKIQIERKTFTLSLKENPRGRFLRIIEDVRGRRGTIIIPSPGLDEFRRVMDEMARASTDLPPRYPK